MEEIRIITLCFAGILTFAFGLAWILPLFAAGQSDTKPSKDDITTSILDPILILLDCIPVFWLFRAIPEAPSACKAARETWRKEPSIRVMFWLSGVSLVMTVGALYFPA